jgi:contact-dependent growth inhibition (CDI) system CdiI-like immunity protein
MQRASAYLRANGYFVHSDSETTCGVWVAGHPYLKLPLDVSAETLSQSVRDALAASREGIEHPTDWDAVEDPLPELGGARSWNEFMKKARYVSITEANGEIRIVPYANRGSAEGFTPTEHAIMIPAESDDMVVGRALADAFRQCQ